MNLISKQALLIILGALVFMCSDNDDEDDEINTGTGNLVVWTQGVGKKVQPTTDSGENTTIELAGPRASYQASQIVIRPERDGLLDVSLISSELRSGSGATIAASNITMFRQWFIDFEGIPDSVEVGSSPVPEYSETGDTRLPDPLIPLINPYDGEELGQPFDVSVNFSQPIWVDVRIPQDTTPGDYAGTIQVSTSSGQYEVPINVEVWDLELPGMSSVPNIFTMRIDRLAAYHRDIEEPDYPQFISWNERARMIVKRYEELAHAHRIDTGQQFIHWPDNGCSPPTSWSPFDEEVALYMDGSYWSDGVPSTTLKLTFSPGHEEWKLGSGCSEAEYEALALSWYNHLTEKEWFDRAVVFALDEPPESAYAAIVEDSLAMQAANPAWKERTIATVCPNEENTIILNPALGTYVVNLPWYSYGDMGDTENQDYGRFSWDELFDLGHQLWFYESNSVVAPSPTWATTSIDGLETTMMFWGSWYESATGFLYWAYIDWNLIDDPWGVNIEWNKPGDGVLVYPGHHDGVQSPAGSPSDVELDGPIPSYRMKMIRMGLQDWALFKMADDAGLGAYAREQVAKVYIQFHGCSYSACPPPLGDFYWDTDEALMADIRRSVAEEIIAARQ